jgi:hypothetical protein
MTRTLFIVSDSAACLRRDFSLLVLRAVIAFASERVERMEAIQIYCNCCQIEVFDSFLMEF